AVVELGALLLAQSALVVGELLELAEHGLEAGGRLGRAEVSGVGDGWRLEHGHALADVVGLGLGLVVMAADERERPLGTGAGLLARALATFVDMLLVRGLAPPRPNADHGRDQQDDAAERE